VKNGDFIGDAVTARLTVLVLGRGEATKDSLSSVSSDVRLQ